MSTNPEVTETIESPDEVIAEANKIYADLKGESQEPPHVVLLKVWLTLLLDGLKTRFEKPTLRWANRIVASHPGMTFASVLHFRDRYFDRLEEAAKILQAVIDRDPGCTDATLSREDDRKRNAAAYLEVLQLWNLSQLAQDFEWDPADPHAAASAAAASEAQRLLLSENGLLGHLESIGVEFTEADQTSLGEAMAETEATLIELNQLGRVSE